MSATWPTDLPQYVQADSYQETYGQTVARSSVDVGPAKVRRRYTARVDTFSVSLKLTAAELTILEEFFVTECSGGATAFTWRHPRTGSSSSCRFVDSPAVTWLEGLYRVTFTLEVLP